MSAWNLSNCTFVGNSPKIRRKATSRKSAFSANSSIEYPRYLKIPFSPSKNVMALSQEPVFLYPGSSVMTLSVVALKLLISMATSFSVPIINGKSYFLPCISIVALSDIWIYKFYLSFYLMDVTKLQNISRYIKQLNKHFNNLFIFKNYTKHW